MKRMILNIEIIISDRSYMTFLPFSNGLMHNKSSYLPRPIRSSHIKRTFTFELIFISVGIGYYICAIKPQRLCSLHAKLRCLLHSTLACEKRTALRYLKRLIYKEDCGFSVHLIPDVAYCKSEEDFSIKFGAETLFGGLDTSGRLPAFQL